MTVIPSQTEIRLRFFAGTNLNACLSSDPVPDFYYSYVFVGPVRVSAQKSGLLARSVGRFTRTAFFFSWQRFFFTYRARASTPAFGSLLGGGVSPAIFRAFRYARLFLGFPVSPVSTVFRQQGGRRGGNRTPGTRFRPFSDPYAAY